MASIVSKTPALSSTSVGGPDASTGSGWPPSASSGAALIRHSS
ncbi:MAG: hypothetical protein JWO63_2930, partial [Frankiales bacterium]|nr:hypothetical protein [Frankiales bacterium]